MSARTNVNTNEEKEIKHNVLPSSENFEKLIARDFENLSNMIFEIVDNCKASGASIVHLRFQELKSEDIRMTISDNGKGIKNIKEALTVGKKNVSKNVDPLHEHGMGIKHVIANMEDFQIKTRTDEQFKNGIFTVVNSPYSLEITEKRFNEETKNKVKNIEGDEESNSWKFESSGTVVSLVCKRNKFNSLKDRVQDGLENFESLCAYFVEELGYMYNDILFSEKKGNAPEGKMKCLFTCKNKDETTFFDEKVINGVFPKTAVPYYDTDDLEKNDGTVVLGKDYHQEDFEIKFNYKVRRLLESCKKTYKIYYQKNRETSGLQLRINGRCMLSNQFREVWGSIPHNKHNDLIVVIDIISDNRSNLPKTTTTKEGISFEDKKLKVIYEWVNQNLQLKEVKPNLSEKELMEALQDNNVKLMNDIDEKDNTREMLVYQPCFQHKKLKLEMDGIKMGSNGPIIIEAKVGASESQHLYQLLMYMDIYRSEKVVNNGGRTIIKGVLISKTKGKLAERMLTELNEQYKELFSGLNIVYEFKSFTWAEIGIPTERKTTGSDKKIDPYKGTLFDKKLHTNNS